MAKIEIGEYDIVVNPEMGVTLDEEMDGLVVGIDVAWKKIADLGDDTYRVVVAGEAEHLGWFEGRHNGDANFV